MSTNCKAAATPNNSGCSALREPGVLCNGAGEGGTHWDHWDGEPPRTGSRAVEGQLRLHSEWGQLQPVQSPPGVASAALSLNDYLLAEVPCPVLPHEQASRVSSVTTRTDVEEISLFSDI